jgi:hypothetical protein
LRRRSSRPEQHSVTWAELAPGADPEGICSPGQNEVDG